MQDGIRGQLIQHWISNTGKYPLQVDASMTLQLLLYWQTKLDKGGILFLYLPHGTQQYWKSWNNKKHVHNFTPEIFREFFSETGWKNHFVTEYDLNNSFYAVAEK